MVQIMKINILKWQLLFRCPIYQPTMLLKKSMVLKAGDYINGELVDSAVNTSDLDASTYTPNTAQDTVVDAGLYINVES